MAGYPCRVADEGRVGDLVSPYRASAALPESRRPRRAGRVRSPVARALSAPLFVGTFVAAVPGVVLGLLNEAAREHGAHIVPRMAWFEDTVALGLVATLPLVGYALVRTSRRFPAPRAVKRWYVRRNLLLYAAVASVAITLVCGLRPPSLALLASAASTDGREAFVYRFWWGCGYALRIAKGPWIAEDVTWVGPFSCEAPPPRVEWEGSSLTIVAADGEVIGTWPADH
jgi:hypothetical protein